MNEFQETIPDPFNVETFRGHVVDIVHRQSIERVADGTKPADISDRNQAKIVLQRLEKLIQSGVTVRQIDDLNHFNPPDGFTIANDSLILGGAFLGQCLEDYKKTLENNGVKFESNPLLTVRA